MKNEFTEATSARKALEETLCDTLDINRVQAAALVERMIDYFKIMRTELRKFDGK